MATSKFKRLIKSKSMLGAILFALALWGYTSLNDDYLTKIEVPLSIKLPQDRALEGPHEENVSVEVRGNGWNLFYLYFFSSSANCIVDLSRTEFQDSIYRVSRSEILKSVSFFENVQAIDVTPDAMNLVTGRIISKFVPVKAISNIKPRDGFTIVGPVKTIPDSVEIIGNEKLISGISEWKTKLFTAEDKHKPILKQVNLSDSLEGVIRLSNKIVALSADIQQLAEIVLYDIPITVRGGAIPKKHKIRPMTINVSLRGGIKTLSGFSSESVSASIGYAQILNDSTGVLKPVVNTPGNVEIIKLEPSYVYHLEISSLRNFAYLK